MSHRDVLRVNFALSFEMSPLLLPFITISFRDIHSSFNIYRASINCSRCARECFSFTFNVPRVFCLHKRTMHTAADRK